MRLLGVGETKARHTKHSVSLHNQTSAIKEHYSCNFYKSGAIKALWSGIVTGQFLQEKGEKKSFIMLMDLLCWNLYQGCFKIKLPWSWNYPSPLESIQHWEMSKLSDSQAREEKHSCCHTSLGLTSVIKTKTAKSFREMRLSGHASLAMYLRMLWCWACVC